MILSLETTTKICSIALHDQGNQIAEQNYFLDKSHSSLLPLIIDQMLSNVDVNKQDLLAIAISSGPGSYTGIRIGISTAKGLSLGLSIPIIEVSALDVLASMITPVISPKFYLAPMIDARRMEVYMYLADEEAHKIWETRALILDKDVFQNFTDRPLYIIGNGATKCRNFIEHPNMIIDDSIFPSARNVGYLAWDKYQKEDFVDLANFDAEYVKEFYTKPPSKKL